jgi:hypothetical protein
MKRKWERERMREQLMRKRKWEREREKQSCNRRVDFLSSTSSASREFNRVQNGRWFRQNSGVDIVDQTRVQYSVLVILLQSRKDMRYYS